MEEELKEAKAQLESALAQAAAETIRADASEKSAAAEKLRADGAEGEVQGLKSRLDSLEKDTKDVDIDKLKEENKNLLVLVTSETKRADEAESQETIDALVNAKVAGRTEIVMRAAPILGKEFRADGMTDDEIRIAVITRLDEAPAADAPPAFLDGCFRTLTKGYEAANIALAKVTQKSLEDSKNRADGDETRTDADTAYEKFVEKQNDLASSFYSRPSAGAE